MSLKKQLETFLANLDTEAIIRKITEVSELSEETARTEFAKYTNEAFFALRVVEKHLNKNQKILEVGSGTCLFAYFLRSEGYNVTALEPTGIGYSFMRSAQLGLMHVLESIDLPLLEIGAEGLSPEKHGKFDLLFSIHVLEHLPSFEDGLRSMDNVLADGGIMVHACPNYSFPYDPHFSIPLLPFLPAQTKYVLPSRISKSGKWASINFIKFKTIRSMSKKLGYVINLEPSVLSEMIERVNNDKFFMERHGRGFSGFAINLFRRLGLLKFVKMLPAELSSPVIFSLVRNP